MRLLPLLPMIALVACQPTPEPVAFSPAGYRHLDHEPPEEALDILRIMDDEVPASALRVNQGCYAAFIDGELVPVQRGGKQYCLG